MIDALAALALLVVAPLFILAVAIGVDRYDEDEYWEEARRRKEAQND